MAARHAAPTPSKRHGLNQPNSNVTIGIVVSWLSPDLLFNYSSALILKHLTPPIHVAQLDEKLMLMREAANARLSAAREEERRSKKTLSVMPVINAQQMACP